MKDTLNMIALVLTDREVEQLQSTFPSLQNKKLLGRYIRNTVVSHIDECHRAKERRSGYLARDTAKLLDDLHDDVMRRLEEDPNV
jgi:hypothetical protein